MSSQTRSMTEGNPYILILTFSLPLMLGNIFQQLYTVVDTMIVGQALGVEALAALGSSDWFNWMMLSAVQGLAQGFAVLMAQEFGAGRFERLKTVSGNSIILAAISTIILIIIGQLLAQPVLALLNTPDDIIGTSLLYLRILFGGIPIVMTYNLLASMLRALGNSKIPLLAVVVAAITNIILDILFVMVFDFGVAGAAVATLIAQFISCIFCLWHIRKIEVLAVSAKHFILQSTIVRQLLYLGTPMCLQNIMISIGGMILQSVVNEFGVIFIAGFAATNKLYGVLELAAISYGYSMITYMGQNLGAQKLDRVRKGMKAALIIAILTSLIIAALMLIFGRPIVSIFISGTPEQMTQTIGVAYKYLAILSIFLPILYILHVYKSAVSGLGNSIIPMGSGIAEFVMRTGACQILPLFFGANGIFYCEPLAWLGADIVLIIGYYRTARLVTQLPLQ